MFREQKAAFRVFLGTLSGLAVVAAMVFVLAITIGGYSGRTAADYAAAVHKDRGQ